MNDFEGRGADYDTPLRTKGGIFTITREAEAKLSPGVHICFRVETRESVVLFHEAALAHGGADDGLPGLRPQYHRSYYAAFVLDPDGHRIEAVCHHDLA